MILFLVFAAFVQVLTVGYAANHINEQAERRHRALLDEIRRCSR